MINYSALSSGRLTLSKCDDLLQEQELKPAKPTDFEQEFED
jgi:hypothetical protein